MLIPGLSGYEERVAGCIARHLDGLGIAHRSDRLGNLIATIPGRCLTAPSVMVFTHMDQLGFIIRKVEDSGLDPAGAAWAACPSVPWRRKRC